MNLTKIENIKKQGLYFLKNKPIELIQQMLKEQGRMLQYYLNVCHMKEPRVQTEI